jgi:membrane associated rhomboid family serine protease
MGLISADVLSGPRTDGVNALYTMIRLAPHSALPYAALMKSPTPLAGGFFLILPIIVGFLWGLTNGRAMQGAVAGLGLGLLLAAVVWLIDWLRQRP